MASLSINNAIDGLSEGGTVNVGASSGVLATDTDPFGYALAVAAVGFDNQTTSVSAGSAVVQGSYGTLTMHADGSYSYAALNNISLPPDGFVQDRFTFTVTDGHGDTGQATLTITVTATGVQYVAAAAGQTVTVGNAATVVDASLGNVTVKAGNGNDVVIAGNNDNITLGNGNDTVVGGSDDTIKVGNGTDVISGGAGDTITAGNGSDTITAGNNSTVTAGNGSDTITAGNSSTVTAGNGSDTITAGNNSAVTAGNGSDTIRAGNNSAVTAGNGSDTITAGTDATITVGKGTDTISAGAGSTVNGGSGVVVPTLTNPASLSVSEDGSIALPITVHASNASETITVKISGIPAGVSLGNSAGALVVTNGSIVLTQAQLAGLTLKAGEVASVNLTVTATGVVGSDSASASGTIALTVNPVAPTLTLATHSLSVNAGAHASLGISETPFDPRDTVSVTIRGVPSDASLSAGTNNGGGSWTLTPGQLSGLTLNTGTTSANLTITATNTLGVTASATQSLSVTVLSVSVSTPTISGTAQEGQTLTASATASAGATVTYAWYSSANNYANPIASGANYQVQEADEGFTLEVKATATNGATSASATSAATSAVLDAAPTVTTPTIGGAVQEGLTLTASASSNQSDNPVTYQWQANGTNITGATGATYVLNESDDGKVITVVATATNDNGAMVSATSAPTAAVPGAPAVLGGAVSASVNEGALVVLGATDAAAYSDDMLGNVTITGLPGDLTNFNGGIYTAASGTWTGTAAQFNALAFNAGEQGTSTLSIVASTTDADTATTTGSYTLTVNPVAEAPTFAGATSASPNESTAGVSLGATVAGDADDNITVTITGLPTDLTNLSGGTYTTAPATEVVNFDSVSTPGGSVDGAPVTNYLASEGITFTSQSGDPTILAYQPGNPFPNPVSTPNWFGVSGPGTGFTYTMSFASPLSSLSFTVPGLGNTSTIVGWSATAYSANGTELGEVGDPSISGPNTSTETYTLTGPGIAYVQFSDDGGSAGNHLALDNLTLNSASTGTWSGTEAQFNALTFTTGEQGTYNLGITATNNTTGESASASENYALTVDPVAEGPVLGGATSATVNEGALVTFSATDAGADSDDTLGGVTITGLPTDLTNVNGGTYTAATGTWTGNAAQFDALTFNAGEQGTYTLSISAATTGAEAATTTGSYTLTVNPVPEGPALGGATSASVGEGGSVTFGATDTALDSDDTLGNVTITGLPGDLTNVNGGTYTAATGTWIGNAAQFNALAFNAGEQGTYHLSIAATTTGVEGATTTRNYTLTVNPVAEAPTLMVGSVTEAVPANDAVWREVVYPQQPTTGNYLAPPALVADPAEGIVGLFYSQIENYDPANNPTGPYAVSQYVVPSDAFLLPMTQGQLIDSATVNLPARTSTTIQNITTSNGVTGEGIVFYQTQDANGNRILNKVLVTGGNANGTLTVGPPVQVENFGTDTVYNIGGGFLSAGSPIATLTGYALAWDQYNAQTQTYAINLQAFNADGSTASGGVINIYSATNVASPTAAPGWRFQNVGNAYLFGLAQPNGTLQFTGYGNTGQRNGVSFQIAPNLSHYASGATSSITQEVIPGLFPTPGGPVSALQFGQLSTGQYFAGWNETVTDLNGTHDQVEFAIYNPANPPNTQLVSQSTFQIADGQAQNIRVFSLPGNLMVLAYGDDTGTHLVEFNGSGQQIASITDPSSVAFSAVTSLGDGRVAVAYDNSLDASHTSQFDTKIFDLRTTGLFVNDVNTHDATNKDFAGTRFNDTVTGENNVDNTYYYVGSSAGSAPSDAFTGGTNGWNVAILPDARSNYVINTQSGMTTLTNVGDPSHAGTLTTTNVQALEFAPTIDQEGNPDLEATGDTLLLLATQNSGAPVSIDNGSTFELATTISGTVTFTGPSGTFRIGPTGTFTGQIAGLQPGDTLDLAGIAVKSATINGSTLTVTETNNQTLSYQIAGALAGNYFRVASDGAGGSDLVLSPIGYLWGSTTYPAQPTAGTHLYGPIASFNGGIGADVLMYPVTTSGYTQGGPDAVTYESEQRDAFLLPYASGPQTLGSTTIQNFPVANSFVLAPLTATQAEQISFYVLQGANGTPSIGETTVTEGAGGFNSPVTVGTPTVVETGLSGVVEQVNGNFANGANGFLSTYEVAWEQFNAGALTVSFQAFNPNGTAVLGPTQILSASNVASETAAPAWFFRSAGAAAAPYALASAQLNTMTGLYGVQVQGYNANGSVNNAVKFNVATNLGAYAAGATNQITQEPLSATHTGSALALQFAPNAAAGTGFSVAWNETVNDSNGTHDQVEFAIVKNGQTTSQSTFQIADGNPQNVRVGTFGYLGNNYEVLAYGDATGTHLVEFDINGNVLANAFDPSTTMFGQLEIFGDGRVGLTYDNQLDAGGTTQYTENVYDFRTSGIPATGFPGIPNQGNSHEFAGTQFNDTINSVAGQSNTYYYVGSATGSTPTDTFTGNGGWNVAIMPDAPSNYTVTNNPNGSVTLTNTGDPAHAGSLTLTDIQEVAFAPTQDPSGNTGSLTATGDELVILGPLPGGGEPITISNGTTLNLDTPDSGTVTFAGPTGTLMLSQPGTFTGAIAGLAPGETIDLADVSVKSTTINGSTLTVTETNNQTLSYQIAGSLAGNYFRVASDGAGGSDLVLSLIGYLWGTSTFPAATTGTHLYGPFVGFNGGLGADALMYGATSSNYTDAGPDQMTYNVELRDAFGLPYASGDQQIAGTTITNFPSPYNASLAALTSTQAELIDVYLLQDANGNASIAQTIETEGTGGLNSPVTSGAQQVIEPGLTGTVEHLGVSTANGSTGLLSSYAVSWDQFNSAAHTDTIDFQIFNASGTTATLVESPITYSNVATPGAIPGWFLRSAGSGATAFYGLAYTQLNAGVDDVEFQAYSAPGNTSGTPPSFSIAPDIAAGATNQIVQGAAPPNHTGGLQALQWAINSGPSITNYFFAWDETVTAGNSTSEQVEFVDTSTGGVVQSQKTFQVADGDAQNIRLQTFSYLGNNYEVLAYGDATGTHLVEFDANGNVLATAFDPSTVTYAALEAYGDGRVGVIYDNQLDSSGTSQYTENVYDFRTSGIPLTYTGISNQSGHEFAGTQFNDTAKGVNNSNNTYDYVGSSTGSAPSDTFTGGISTNGSAVWNVAVTPDARSNYAVTTQNGVTTLVNWGDAQHAGTLALTNVQAVAFAPTQDPSGNTGSLTATGDTLLVLGPLPNGGGEPITISNNATVELATPDSGTVTYGGPHGTLRLDQSATFTGQIAGFVSGEGIDLADVSFTANTTLSYAGSTLTVSDGTHTANLALAGAYSAANFSMWSDGHGGTMVTEPGATPTINMFEGTSVALNLSAVPDDADDVVSVTLSGLPAGVTLSSGVNNGNGTWTLTPAQLSGLALIAKEQATATLTVKATASEGNSTAAAPPQTILLNVTAVPEAPSLAGTTTAVSMNEGATVALPIKLATDNDEVVSITVSGLPTGATLSAGTNNGNGSWTLTPAQLSNLTLTAGEDAPPTTLTVTATNLSEGGTSSQNIALTVNPVAEPPALTVSTPTLSVNEDGSVALGISVSGDADDTISVTITGLPPGASLSVGMHNPDGSWTLTEAQINAGVTLNAGDLFTNAATLGITATNSTPGESASTTGSISLTINPVAEPPSLSIANPTLSVNEDGTISLGMSVGGDIDDSISVTITGVPNGATLSKGTLNSDGSWTLTSDEVNTGVNLIAGEDLSTPATLVVTATNNTPGETASTTGSISLAVNPVAEAPILSVGTGPSTDGSITITSDGSVLAAAAPLVVGDLDTPNVSGLTFVPVDVGASGTFTQAPPGAPSDTEVINIPPANGQSGYFEQTFTLPSGFTNASISGAANVDDIGRVFLNGNPLTSSIASGGPGPGEVSEFANTTFSSSDQSFFQAGTNTLLISDANTGGGPSGAAFFANVTYASLSGPTGDSTSENTPLTINGITLAAVDNDDALSMNLAVAHGTLALGSSAGLTITSDGTDGTLAFSGSQASISAALASGVVYTPTLEYEGTDTLTVTGTSSEGSSSASSTQTLALTVDPAAEGPVLGGATSATVREGRSVTFGATDTPFDSDDTLGNVTITGLPGDLANVNGGTYTVSSGVGTWSGSAAQFNTLAFTAGEAGTFNLSISAATTGAEADTTTGSYTLTVNPVAEGPVLGGATSASVNEGGSVTFGATDAVLDADDTLGNVTITGLPADLSGFNGGTYAAATGTWTGSAAQFNALSFTAGEDGTYALSISATTTGAEAGTTTGSYTLTFNPVAEPPSLAGTVTSVTVGEDQSVALPIMVTPQDADDNISITVSGVPSGATLSAGMDNGNGSWTLTPSQLSGLTLTAGEAITAPVYSFSTIDDPAEVQPFGTVASGINGDGLIVGSYNSGFNGSVYGFLYDGTSFGTTIAYPGPQVETSGRGTFANGINDSGEVVGNFTDASFQAHGFLYDPAAASPYSQIDAPGATTTEASGINASGEIVGLYVDSNGSHAYVDDGGSFTTLSGDAAYGINNLGEVVGTDGSNGFLYNPGDNTYSTITDPLATGSTVATGVNDAGEIVGYYTDAAGTHGFLDDAGTFTTFDDTSATAGTYALGINDSGEIVGKYVDSVGVHGFVAQASASVAPPTPLTVTATNPEGSGASTSQQIELTVNPVAEAPTLTVPVGSDVLGYWSFNGNANDQSGNGNALTLNGGATIAGGGQFGDALSLDGVPGSDAMASTNNTAFNFGSGDFTIQVWAKFNAITDGREETLIEKFNGGGGPGWTLTLQDGNNIQFYAAPGVVLNSGPEPIPNGVWQEFTVERSGNDFGIYWDGNLVASTTSSAALPASSNPLLIGARDAQDGRNFTVNGLIDNVAILNTALTPTQIARSWNDGAGTQAGFSTNENTPLTINGITLAAADSDDALSMNLSVAHGTLALGSSAGLTITSDGSNGTLAFTGSQASISAALASGLIYTPADEYEGGDTLTVTGTSSEGSSSASSTQTVALTVNPVPEPPSLAGTATSVTVTEDQSVALPIVLTPQDADDDITITVAGLPSGDTLSAGTSNGNGTWTLTPAELNGLTLTAGEETSATLTVTATNSEGAAEVSPVGGLFGAATNYATGNYPLINAQALEPLNGTVTDINGDGTPDIITANVFSNDISVLLGNGDGTFQPAVTYPTGTFPNDLKVADLAGNGKQDLIVADYKDNDVSVLLGNGDGTFQPRVTYATGVNPYMVDVADVNGDGKLDLITPDNGSNSVSVLLGNGDGTFQPQETYAVGESPAVVETADLAHNGIQDLIVVNFAGTVSVLMGNGDGTFQPATTYQVGSFPTSVAIADLANNGNLDLIVPNNASGTISVLKGNGDGTFQQAVNYQVGATPNRIIVADFNGDGIEDIATANQHSGTVSVLLGNGDGTFQQAVNYQVGGGPIELAAADINGDGKTDIVVGDSTSNDIGVLLGNGDGTFQPVQLYPVGSSPYQLALASLTSDGKLDAIVANTQSSDVSVLLNQTAVNSAQATINLDVTPAAEPASLAGTATSVTANEGQTVALPITVTPYDGDDNVSITIAGVPTGTTLSAGTNEGNGTWSLTSAQLANLTLTAGEDTTTTLTVTATNSEGAGASSSQAITLTVNPVAEAPAFAGVTSGTANESTAGVSLGASVAGDADDNITVTITGLPTDLTNLSGGSYTTTPGTEVVNFDSVDTSGGAVSGATVTNYLASEGITFSGPGDTPTILPYEPGNPFPIPVSSPNWFGVGGPGSGFTYTLSFASAVNSLSFTVPGLGSTSTMVGWSATAYSANGTALGEVGDPSESFPGSQTQTYTLTGPGIAYVQFTDDGGGAGNHLALDNLTLNSTPNGTWTGTAAQFDALTFTTGEQGTYNLDITATNNTAGEVASASENYALTVNPVAEAPSLAGTPAALTVNAGTRSALPVVVTPQDADDTVSVTVAGVPAGATLSAGTSSGGGSGTWTLTPAQLAGLQITTAAPSYTFATSNAPSGTNTTLTGINDSGEIVAATNSGVNASKGALFVNGSWVTLTDPAVSGDFTLAEGINNAGEVVGYYTDNTNAGTHGLLYSGGSNGTFMAIDYPSAANGTEALGISSSGEIVGIYLDANNVQHAFTDVGGNFLTYDDPSAGGTAGRGTIFNGINSTGTEIVGSYYDSSGLSHGLIYEDGGFTTIDDPMGAKGTFLQGVNDAGQIVGYYFDSQGLDHGFVYSGGSNGTFTTIDDPMATNGSRAFGINDAGQVVGISNAGVQNGYVATPVTGSATLTVTASNSEGSGASSSQTIALTEAAPLVVGTGATVTVSGASSSMVTFNDGTGTLQLSQSTAFTGGIAGFAGQDGLDLGNLVYNAATTTLGYTPNSAGTGGTLMVSDGTHTANLAMVGNYTASSFTPSSDGQGGTLIKTH